MRICRPLSPIRLSKILRVNREPINDPGFSRVGVEYPVIYRIRGSLACGPWVSIIKVTTVTRCGIAVAQYSCPQTKRGIFLSRVLSFSRNRRYR